MPQNSSPNAVILIGAGRMGAAHAAALAELGLPVSHVCDSRPDSLTAFRERFGLAPDRCYLDPRALLQSEPQSLMVAIATTADSHAELTCLAARAGARHVLCEKPMATSVADCDAMVKACSETGTRLAINHQMRFMNQYTLVKQELESGRFGPLASMNVVAGCFGLAMNGSHYIEAYCYLTDSIPESVTAWFSPEQLPNPRGSQFFDQAGEVRVVGTGGQRLNLEIGSDQGHGMTSIYATAYGHIFVDELAGSYIATARKAEHRDMPMTRYGMPWDRWQETFPQADNIGPTRAVLRALLDGHDYPDGERGRLVVATLAAAYKSSENGNKAVALHDLGDYRTRHFPWA